MGGRPRCHFYAYLTAELNPEISIWPTYNLVTKRNEFKFGLRIFELLPYNKTTSTFVGMDVSFDWHMTLCIQIIA